jgi:hypothetical protein
MVTECAELNKFLKDSMGHKAPIYLQYWWWSSCIAVDHLASRH